LENYRSSILDIFQNHVHIRESWLSKPSFNRQMTRPSRRINLDQSTLLPSLLTIPNFGFNQYMSLSDLIEKVCRLLGVCGFLQPSDIDRSDLASSDWTSNAKALCLRIAALK